MLTFTVINHEAQRDLGLSMVEYAVANSIYNLSHGKGKQSIGWCFADKKTIAQFLCVNKSTVTRAISKLLEVGLLEKNSSRPKNLRTTIKWYEAVISKGSQNERQNESRQEAICTSTRGNLHPSTYKETNIQSNTDMSLSQRIDKNVEEAESDSLHIEQICLLENLEIDAVIRLIRPWAKENATTIFQGTNHRRNSFKKFVRSSQMRISHKSNITSSGSTMIKPGESRRRLG